MGQAALHNPWLEAGQVWSARHRRWLRRAVWISIALHLLALIYTLLQPKPSREEVNTLEVILVNSQTETVPVKADARAQVALDGGGDQKSGRAKSPVPAREQVSAGARAPAARESNERMARLEAQQKALQDRLSRAEGDLPREAGKKPDASVPKPVPATRPEPALANQDFRASASELARLEAQIARQVEDYNKRPRLHFFAPSTSPYVFALYEEQWRQKVERYGNLNYPDDAKGRVYGQLRMTVYIRQDGSLQDFVLDKSSGSPILDRAARRIVEMAGPYGAFTPEMAKAADVLVITRTWMFTNDSLETRQR